MVLKEQRRVNSGSVAKRQQLRSDANAQKVLAEEREKERVLAAAWAAVMLLNWPSAGPRS